MVIGKAWWCFWPCSNQWRLQGAAQQEDQVGLGLTLRQYLIVILLGCCSCGWSECRGSTGCEVVGVQQSGPLRGPFPVRFGLLLACRPQVGLVTGILTGIYL